MVKTAISFFAVITHFFYFERSKKKMNLRKRRKVCSESKRLERRKTIFRNIVRSRSNYFRIIREIDDFDGDIRKEFLKKLDEKDHYVFFQHNYQFFHFNHKAVDDSRIYPMSDFEDACKMVFNIGNLFGYRYKKIMQVIRGNYRKSKLRILLETYFDDFPYGYRKQIDFLLYKLAKAPTDTEKRQEEAEYLDYASRMFLRIEGILIPEEIILLIFSFLDHPNHFRKITLVCEEFYVLFLRDWDRIRISRNNIYRVPIPVLMSVKKVTLKTKGIEKSDFEYFFEKVLSLRELVIDGITKTEEFFSYLNKVQKYLTKISVIEIGYCLNIKPKLLPKVRKLEYRSNSKGDLNGNLKKFFGQITHLKILNEDNLGKLRHFKKLEFLYFSFTNLRTNTNIIHIKNVKTLKKIKFADFCHVQTTRLFRADHTIEKIIRNEMEVETISIQLHFAKFKRDDLKDFSKYLSLIDKLNKRCRYLHLNLIRKFQNIHETFYMDRKLLNELDFKTLPKNYRLIEKKVVRKKNIRFSYNVLKYKFVRKL